MRPAYLLATFLAAGMAPAAEVDYLREVKPILAVRCFACHGAVRQKAGFRLDAIALLRKGGRHGPAIVAGKAEESLLIDAVRGRDRLRMPPESEGPALSEKDVATLETWINQGARAPQEPIPADPRAHWAFRPPTTPPIPAVAGAANPIDALLAAERSRRRLTPNPPADKSTLLRRVYLDLVGLPPTREEVHAFLADPAPDAYEKVVARLLASPQYGERWGRHWMDVWRYSDPFGLGEEYRYSQRHIWRWRDWIIESLNADKGYGRMVIEMLAGDEVAPADRDTLRATGFLARNWYKFNRNAWLQDTVEHTAAGFLGLTLRCARCHDHKFDPIPQQDYYRFRAFFEPHDVRIDPVRGQPNVLKDGVARVFDSNPVAPTYLFVRGDDRNPDRSRVLPPGVPPVLGGEPEIRPVIFGGAMLAPALEAAAATASANVTPLGMLSLTTSTGRRLALARWITRRDNPLTARVAVNHIWMRHFGKPLVPSVANFGLSGQPPNHPALLDFLAVRFMDDGWSMKKLHRLIVTSQTYRLGSQAGNDNNPQIDPENRYLWRMNPRRMEAEVVRDSLLALAGQLDLARGGPPLSESLGQTSRRRSIYFRFNTQYKMAFLEQFDAASPSECYERHESVVPQQALALGNSALALNQARLLARRLAQTAGADFVTVAFEQVLGRAPTTEEHGRCERFLREQTALLQAPGRLTPFPPNADAVTAPAADAIGRAHEDLIHVLFNHNDFVTIR
jgi:hypothetical protein